MNDLTKSEKILFTNCFTLKLSHTTIEEMFEENIRKNNPINIIFIVLQTILLSSGLITLHYLDLTSANQFEYVTTQNYGYLCSSFLAVSLILFFLQFKYFKVAKAYLYFNYISMKMVIFFFHEYMKFLLGDETFYKFDLLLISTEFQILICYLLFFDKNF